MAKVRALISFVGRVEGQRFHATHGQILDMPEGANWVETGLAAYETATDVPAETRQAVSAKDDLTRLKGVGPRTAVALKDLDISTFQALLGAESHYLAHEIVGASLEDVEDWKDQARRLISG